jgi:LPXTG-site transpeptidase (sortase) family protein
MGRHARPRILSRVDRTSLAAIGVAGFGVAVISGISLHADLGIGRPAGQAVLSASTPLSASPTTVTVAPTAASTTPTEQQTAALYPVAVSIPSIKVNTTLQMLTLDSAGALNPPTNLTQAGWYTGSAVPGQLGPSVLAGHIDSTTGPAVFYRLVYLKAGDTVTVTLSDQSTVEFVVTTVESYPKDDFPTVAVYGPVPDAELRLITCGGGFANGHYLNNTVVYARLASSSA